MLSSSFTSRSISPAGSAPAAQRGLLGLKAYCPEKRQELVYSEAMNEQGLEQFLLVFEDLQQQAAQMLPDQHPELGRLAAVDGSLINAALSMDWAQYRKGVKRAKPHTIFDLTSGQEGERPFAGQILAPGQTSVCDQGCQDCRDFGQLQAAGKRFVIRIKENSLTTCTSPIPCPLGVLFF